MKKFRPFFLLLITLGAITLSSPTHAQSQCTLLQVSNAAAAEHASSANYWFGVTWGLSGPGIWSIYKASRGA